MGIVRLIALIVATSAWLCAQDPYKIAPNNYRLEFQNEYTRVSRATLRPGDKIPTHDHPAFSTVYVYLTDAGPAMFSHDSPAFTVKRPAVQAGGIRINRGMKETHHVEYLGSAPSEYLRIELRNDPPLTERTTRLAVNEPGPFENAKLRVRRAACPAAENCAAEFPSVMVSIDKRTSQWVNRGEPIVNDAGPTPLILIEFKTPPSR
jgi:hypothetical protein